MSGSTSISGKGTPEDGYVTRKWLHTILEQVQNGMLPIAEAVEKLSILPYEDLGYAKLDHHRGLRTGFPEVVFGRGKTVEQIVAIAGQIAARSDKLLITHVDAEVYGAVKIVLGDAVYNPVSLTIAVDRAARTERRPGIAVLTGGTADVPVAEEAAVAAELMDNEVERVFDVGVAGIHRLLDNLPALRRSRVLIVVAGMEGALPGVVGGMVSIPVIAVPTSVGYGAAFNGLAPLLTMLNSCAPGIAVVNIDNGFGAGYLAGLINAAADGEERNE